MTFYSINSSDVLERHYASVCTFIREDASRLLISIFLLDLFGCLEYFIGIPWKWTRIIYFIYMGRISLLTLYLPLYLSLSEIEVDNIFFQHKGSNPQEQYFLSMKFCMDWTFSCKRKYPNISYFWFVRILSFVSLTYFLFFFIYRFRTQNRLPESWLHGSSSSFSHLYLPHLHRFPFHFCTSKQRRNQLHYWLWQGFWVDSKDT